MVFFFFKQKTAYEMRISDWSSDVCSSDLTEGLGVLKTFGELVGEFYLSLIALWVLLFAAGSIFLGRRMVKLIRYVREPILIAFSTASSEAAYPKMLEQLEDRKSTRLNSSH